MQIKCDVDDECCICLQKMRKRPIAIHRCGHAMHLSCERKLLQSNTAASTRCPLCRDSFVEAIDIYANIVDYWQAMLGRVGPDDIQDQI